MQTIQKIRLLMAIAVALLSLAACKPDETEKTYTVGEFLHDPELLKNTRGSCMSNPAEREKKPNCINSNRALLVQSSGALGKCYKKGGVDHACINAYQERMNLK